MVWALARRSQPHQSCKGYKILSERFLFSRYLRGGFEQWTHSPNGLFLATKLMKEAANPSQHPSHRLCKRPCDYPLTSHTQPETACEMQPMDHTWNDLWDKGKDKSKNDQALHSWEGREVHLQPQWWSSLKRKGCHWVLFKWLELGEMEENRGTDAKEQMRGQRKWIWNMEYEYEYGKG